MLSANVNRFVKDAISYCRSVVADFLSLRILQFDITPSPGRRTGREKKTCTVVPGCRRRRRKTTWSTSDTDIFPWAALACWMARTRLWNRTSGVLLYQVINHERIEPRYWVFSTFRMSLSYKLHKKKRLNRLRDINE